MHQVDKSESRPEQAGDVTMLVCAPVVKVACRIGLFVFGIVASITSVQADADTARLVSRHLLPEHVNHGQTLFEQHCAVCHGRRGVGPAADWRIRLSTGRYPPPPLNGTAHTWHHSNAQLIATIKRGSVNDGGIMPAFDKRLSDQDIDSVLAYIKSLWPDEVYLIWRKQWGER